MERLRHVSCHVEDEFLYTVNARNDHANYASKDKGSKYITVPAIYLLNEDKIRSKNRVVKTSRTQPTHSPLPNFPAV